MKDLRPRTPPHLTQKTWNHGGNLNHLAQSVGCKPGELLDFSANMNPMGPPKWLGRVINQAVPDLTHYPDPFTIQLVEAAQQRWGVDPSCQIWGNGVSQLLFQLPHVLRGNRVLIPTPCYNDYSRAFVAAGYEVVHLEGDPEAGFEINLKSLLKAALSVDVVVIGNPQNPTGSRLEPNTIRRLARMLPHTILVVDEAFIDFMPDSFSLLPDPPHNVVVLRSLTKFYCIPGLRLGLLVAQPEMIQPLKAVLPAWSVNHLAQIVGVHALADHDYSAQSLHLLEQARTQLTEQLTQIKEIEVLPSEVNYLLCRLSQPHLNARDLGKTLLADHKIAIRVCDNIAGLDESWFRIAVRCPNHNQRLLTALQTTLATASEPSIP